MNRFHNFLAITLCVIMAVVIIVLVTQNSSSDCSDLYRENEQLKKDLKFTKSEYKDERKMHQFFRTYWISRLKNHDEKCKVGWFWKPETSK